MGNRLKQNQGAFHITTPDGVSFSVSFINGELHIRKPGWAPVSCKCNWPSIQDIVIVPDVVYYDCP